MPAILVSPHLLLSPRLWGQFGAWYFWKKPVKIATTTVSYMAAVAEICSFVFLVRTLFYPWKSITEEYQTRGFNMERLMETLTLNLTSRIIGAVIRIVAIAIGLLLEACVACVGIFLIFVWYAFPVLCVWPFIL